MEIVLQGCWGVLPTPSELTVIVNNLYLTVVLLIS
jgi:hypothetical protein